MQIGHVFRISNRIYGILTYSPRTHVLCRVIETDSIPVACEKTIDAIRSAATPKDSLATSR